MRAPWSFFCITFFCLRNPFPRGHCSYFHTNRMEWRCFCLGLLFFRSLRLECFFKAARKWQITWFLAFVFMSLDSFHYFVTLSQRVNFIHRLSLPFFEVSIRNNIIMGQGLIFCHAMLYVRSFIKMDFFLVKWNRLSSKEKWKELIGR